MTKKSLIVLIVGCACVLVILIAVVSMMGLWPWNDPGTTGDLNLTDPTETTTQTEITTQTETAPTDETKAPVKPTDPDDDRPNNPDDDRPSNPNDNRPNNSDNKTEEEEGSTIPVVVPGDDNGGNGDNGGDNGNGGNGGNTDDNSDGDFSIDFGDLLGN